MSSKKKAKQYCVFIKDFKDGRQYFLTGMVGICEREPNRKVKVSVLDEQMHCTTVITNLKLLSKEEAGFLLSLKLPDRSRWLCNDELLKSVCSLQRNDVVQLSTNKVGIVKDILSLSLYSELKKTHIVVELLDGIGGKTQTVHPSEIVCVSSSSSATASLHAEERKLSSEDEEAQQKLNGRSNLASQRSGLSSSETNVADYPACSSLSSAEHHKDPSEVQHPSNTAMNLNIPDLEIGSMVEVKAKNNATVYGVLRWIGKLSAYEEDYAGIELDYEMKECTDGTFKGQRFFRCASNRGMFIKLAECKPDGRFLSSLPQDGFKSSSCPKGTPVDGKPIGENTTTFLLRTLSSGKVVEDEDLMEDVPPVTESEALLKMEGRMKGIQGHYNSCYLDSALFSLFSFSPVLDSILHLPLKQEEKVQEILRREIVNPLRKTGFVSAESVMKLRKSLRCESFTFEEKDPEEFLTLLLHQVLAVDPLIKIRSCDKIQECYSYQIIMEQDNALKVPSVQQLLERSFLTCNLKFEEIPSCLIIQMPRFGKAYKMFPKIVPSLELDVTDLLYNTPRECFICGRLAEVECYQCVMDPYLMPGKNKQFCCLCNKQVHIHRKRQDHVTQKLDFPVDVSATALFPRYKLELFAVLCIQTSHYVSFVKYGPSKTSWLFFDSMADRQGGVKGRNIPEIKACPQVGEYLTMSEEELASVDLKQMDEFAKRFFCDMYMCMYQCPALYLYR
ncbi:ubiquitin carboxyl-terminal hydrolase CYLD-like [Protopterus annectens]|uniref:ubiquitin carboxyl-terminal hydrolase CYLD-like n=1 Tax=Protopterus annectens TaxID=7888 RepID=UPI001CFC1854|nr:ubiquitin carboxyl-terminal hydrolase CYLD-like [Protopterus annectens]XP_043946224.1 ubiquitin carboxyl-terminal hydrolase CYLD-like [Protopterus annectens]